MKILARVQDSSLQEAVAGAASELSAELIVVLGESGVGEQQLLDGLRSHPALLLVEAGVATSLKRLREETRARSTALVVACASADEVQRAVDARADEWLLLPVKPDELVGRLSTISAWP